MISRNNNGGAGVVAAQNHFYGQAYNLWDSVAYLGGSYDTFDWYMDFSPGDTTQYFRGEVRVSANSLGTDAGTATGGYGYQTGSLTLNATSAVPTEKKRVNYIRFGGYKVLSTSGSGGHTPAPFTSGTWYLLGLKA